MILDTTDEEISMTPEQKREIIKFIKKYINQTDEHGNTNGYCRVGYAGEQVTGKRITTANRENIAYSIIEDGDYQKERAEKPYSDWNIFKSRTPLERKIQFKRNLLSVTFGVLLGLIPQSLQLVFKKDIILNPTVLPNIQIIHDTVYKTIYINKESLNQK